MDETNHLQNQALANLRGVVMYCLDTQYRYTAFTLSHREAMKAIWGVDISKGGNILEYIHREDDRMKAKGNFDKVLAGERLILEEEHKDEAGLNWMWRENHYAPIYDTENKIVGLMVFVVDITRRKEIEARNRQLAFIMNKVSSAVVSTDMDLKITYWNKSAETLYGWQESEALGRVIDEVCGTEFLEGQQDIARQTLIVEKNWRGELKQHHRSGTEIWVDASVTLLEDEYGKPIGGVTIIHDVTERKLTEDELRRTKDSIEQINLTLRRAFEREQLASRTDSLTGAFNRRYFFELLEYEFTASQRYQRPLSLVMFDVDFLKNINDTFGHLAGDAVLKKTAQVVRAGLRDSDVLARYGGDEFVILLSNSGDEDAAIVLSRIYEQVNAARVETNGKRLGIAISAGISSLQPGMDHPDQLVMQADRALYSAKNSGRNRMIVHGNEEEE